MIKSIVLSTFLCFCIIICNAQVKQSPETTRFYAGAHIGSPLFWGDLRSLGDETHFGHGGGILGGYRINSWIGLELQADYLQGRLGAASWQVGDKINDLGELTYTSGRFTLDQIYSKVQLFRFGLRTPVQLLRLFGHRGRFQIEAAPHLYINHFTPGLYTYSTDQKWIPGFSPESWSLTTGGDFGLSYKTGEKTRLFLRSSFTWIHDAHFDGIRTQPDWKENYMVYTSVGITFNFGNKLKSKKRVSTPPTPPQIPASPVEKPDKKPQPSPPTPAAKPVSEEKPKVEAKPKEDIKPVDWEAVIYFGINEYTVNEPRDIDILQKAVELARENSSEPILIEGWADASGPVDFNNLVSEKRAQAFANYLIEHGIAPSRIQSIGQGIDSSEQDSAKKRRAEIRFKIMPKVK